MMTYSTAKNGDIRLSDAGFSATVPVGHKRHAELTELAAAGEITIALYAPPTQAELDAAQNTRDLTPPEFEWLLAYTGLEDIWTGLEQNFKGPDRRQYAFLRGTRKKAFFNLAATLTMVAQFRAAAESIDPTVDLSDATITAAWAEATQSGV